MPAEGPSTTGTFAPLRHVDFRYVWLAMLLTNLGTVMQAVAAGWVMTTLTSSAEMVGLIQTATTLPIMLFSLGSGALADNYDRRRIMLCAQSLVLSAATALGVIGYFDLLSPWLLLALTFATGSGTALHNPSWQASVGDFVPRQDIPGAVTLNGMSFNLMRSVGPAVGGFLLAFAGATVSFVSSALAYLPLIAALSRWKPNHPARTLPRENFGSAIVAGLRYVSMSPSIMTVMSRACLFGVSAIAILALLPVLAEQVLGGGPLTFGALLGSFGAGGALGAMLNARLRSRLSNEAIVRIACLVFAVAVPGVAYSGNPLVGCVLLVPTGACWVALMSLFNAVIQLSTPRWVVGRVISIYQIAAFGGMALGSWFWGGLADMQGPVTTLWCAATMLSVCALIGLRYPMPGFATFDLSPLNQFREPHLQLAIEPRSGPIEVTVEYVIDQCDVPAFLRAMAQRRRIRIRDGARRWTLLRDLENAKIWTESYHVPTWVEYVRHNQRRTRADAEISEKLSSLHRRPEPPRIRRLIERHIIPPSEDLPLKPETDIH